MHAIAVAPPTYLLYWAALATELAAINGILAAEVTPDSGIWGNGVYRMAIIAGAMGGMFFAMLWCWPEHANGKRISTKIFAQPLLAFAFTPWILDALNRVVGVSVTTESILAVSFTIGAAGTSIIHLALPALTDRVWPAFVEVLIKWLKKKEEE